MLLAVALLSLAMTPLCAAQKNKIKLKKTPFSLQEIPNQHVEVKDVPDVLASQKCENFAWAADVEATLRKQGIPLDQHFWTDKIYGGALCLPSAGSFHSLKKHIDGDYVLPDGRHVHLEAFFQKSTPNQTDQLLLPLVQQRPFLLYWRDHAYLVIGARWNAFVYPTGQRDVQITQLTLVDPYGQGKDRIVEFDPTKQNLSELGGIFEVQAAVIDTDPWKAPERPLMVPQPANPKQPNIH